MGKILFMLSVSAFALHIIWENAQAPLFSGYVSFGQHFPMCLKSSIGDVIFSVLIYLGISLAKADFNWMARCNKKDVAILAVIGFFFAVGIEQRALLFNTWGYTAAMPIIPYIRVGLAPVLQMTFLLPLSFFITAKFVHRFV